MKVLYLAPHLHSSAQPIFRLYQLALISHKFYALAGCAIRFEQRHGSLSLWCRNLTQTRYDVFYFESIGNAFLQRGRPREWGVTLTINLQHNER